MKSLKVADGLPAPKAYLMAGLPRPQNISFGPSENTVAPAERRRAVLNADADEPSIAPRSTTFLDDAGDPDLVVFHRSSQYLTAPCTEDLFAEDVLGTSRTAEGLLDLQLGPRKNAYGRKERAGQLDMSTAKIVTFDKSVVIAGLDRALFRSTDALFASAAINIEFSVVLGKGPVPSGRIHVSERYWSWDAKNPVPLDSAVVGIFVKLHRRMEAVGSTRPELDRTDLLCAATAILYDSPMYTTAPERYSWIKSGLKLLEYGPIRNPAVLKERGVNSPPATSTVAVGANNSADDYVVFTAEEPTLDQTLVRLSGDPEKLAEFVNDVLSDDGTKFDDEDRITVLKAATRLAPALQKDDTWHYDIMAATSQIIGTGDEIEQELAATAYGIWGRWPDDVSDDFLSDLANEPDDPSLFPRYKIFLEMAGVDPDATEKEMNAVYSGSVIPSRERIDRLSGN